MPNVNIGGATYTLSVDDTNFVRTLQRDEQAAVQRAQNIRRQLGALPVGANTAPLRAALAQAEQDAARASGQIQNRLNQIGPAATVQSRIMGNAFVQQFGAMAAASVSLVAIVQEFKAIGQAANESSVAQRNVAVQYGRSAQQTLAFTQQLAAETRTARTEQAQAAGVVASLRKNYGLTSAEIQTLLKRSTDLAAVTGLDVVDASKRAEAAIRGETESSERFGASLQQNALKGSTLLTESEKARLATMGNVEAAHIRLRVLLEQTSFAEGAAAKGAREGANNFALLDAAVKNLNTTLGESTGVNTLAGYLTTAAGSLENLVRIYDVAIEKERQFNELRRRDKTTGTTGNQTADAGLGLAEAAFGVSLVRTGLDLAGVTKEAKRYNAELLSIKQATIDASYSQTVFARAIKDFTTDSAQQQIADLTQELEAANRQGQQLAATIQDDVGRLAARANLPQSGVNPLAPTLDERAQAAQKAADQVVQREQEAARQRKAAADRAADQGIAAAERERDGLIAASKAKHDAALADLQDQVRASDAAFEAQRRQYERDRDAAIATADAVRTVRLAGIKAAEDAESARLDTLARNNERERDRELGSAKEILDYQAEQARLGARKLTDSRQEDDRLTRDSRQEFDRARGAAFDAQATADRTRHEQRLAALKQEADAARSAGDAALQAIQAEQDALQRRADQALSGLDRERAVEQRRHDEAIAHIDREAARESATIQKRLDALTAASDAERRQREDSTQRKDVAAAQLGLRDARASGDPQAIKQAQEDLASALEQIAQTHRDRQRDEDRAALQAQLASVAKQAQVKKDAADAELAESQRRAEIEKAAVQEQLASALAALATRGDAEKTATEATLASVQQRSDAENTAFSAAEQGAQAKFAADTQRIADLRQLADDTRADQRLKEDRALEDSGRANQAAYDAQVGLIHRLYDDPDSGILSKIKEEQDASRLKFEAERADAQQTYDEAVTAVRVLYDGPDGLLQNLADAKTASDDDFQRQRARIDGTYDDEIQKVNTLYNGPFGLIQRLKDAKTASDEYFDRAIDDWKKWGDSTKEALDAANPRLLEYIANLERIQALGGTPLGSGQDPGGFVPGTVVSNTSGGPLTADQNLGVSSDELRQAFQAAGLSPALIAAACGPIAAAGLAEAFGEAGANIDPAEVLKKAKQNNAFTDRTTNFAGVAAAAGIAVHSAGEAEALGALKAGSPVVINQRPSGGANGFPGHYLLAQGIDAAGNIDLGNTGHIVGLGRTATLAQIRAKGGGLAYYVADPTSQQQQRRQGAPGGASQASAPANPVLSAGNAAATESYIKASASRKGFTNPSIPVAVWVSEGAVTGSGPGDFNTNGRASSFGPFQLHYGGLGQPHSAAGLGDTFTQASAIRPGDPRFETASIDFALDYAKAHGWTAFHGWKGDPWAGIKAMALGGLIDRPTLLVDMAQRRPYAVAGERGPEHVVPIAGRVGGIPSMPSLPAALAAAPGAGDLYLQVQVGGRALEDFTISTMDRAQRDGRWRSVPRA